MRRRWRVVLGEAGQGQRFACGDPIDLSHVNVTKDRDGVAVHSVELFSFVAKLLRDLYPGTVFPITVESNPERIGASHDGVLLFTESPPIGFKQLQDRALGHSRHAISDQDNQV